MKASISGKTHQDDVGKKPGTKIRAGIVGAGLMGRWHAQALEKVGGKVVAIADFDLDQAQKMARRRPHAKMFRSVEKMISEQDIDVIHICSPTESHNPVAEPALNRGIHLLIEKPLAATAGETARLYQQASRNNALLCPVHQFAFQDGVGKARRSLARIGEIIHLEARVCSTGGNGAGSERLTQIGADILPHPLSLIRKFLGGHLKEFEWNGSNPASGELRFWGQNEKSVSVSIFISMNARPTTNSFHLLGTNGTIHLDLFHGFAVIEPGKTSRTRKILHPFDLAIRSFSAATGNLARRIVTSEPAYPGLRQLIREFYQAIRRGDGNLPIAPTEAIDIAETRDLLLARAGIDQTF